MDSVNGYEAPALREFPAPSTTAQVARTRLADHVYTHLLQRIVTGEYAEGAALPPENGLCGMFGVSRPVVREALDRLRADELIESRRGSGTYVRPRVYDAQAETPLLLQKRQKLYLRNLEFRGAIEPRAAALAALRHTPAQLDEMKSAVDRYEQVAVNKGTVAEHLDFAFHQAVAQASNNDHFTDAIRSIAFDIDHGVNLLRYLANFHHIARSRSVLADHTRILEAIARRDAGAAEAAMREHIQHAWLRVSEPLPLVDADPTNPTI